MTRISFVTAWPLARNCGPGSAQQQPRRENKDPGQLLHWQVRPGVHNAFTLAPGGLPAADRNAGPDSDGRSWQAGVDRTARLAANPLSGRRRRASAAVPPVHCGPGTPRSPGRAVDPSRPTRRVPARGLGLGPLLGT